MWGKTCENLHSLHFWGYWGKEEGLRVEGEVGDKVGNEVWEFPGWERKEEIQNVANILMNHMSVGLD